ncbi:MAG: YchF/TatD family DNA exonuclease [Candidatus Nealsonbacteria bacterium]|nr:YchF/TatD family DNA exonuclease [Candidatus Nealsonbacteria bacterium]
MYIDTHAHLNFKPYNRDREEVIKRCLDNGIWVVNVGSNLETSRGAVEISSQYPEGMYAAVGLHPINLDTGLVRKQKDDLEDTHYEKEFDFEYYEKLATSQGVVAIGEVGLDYYWKPKTKKKRAAFKQKQKYLLGQELSLAKKLNLPVIFHCRMAHPDLIQFLKVHSELKPEKAVAHSFVGSEEELQSYLDLGFYIGFNGIIFKNIQGIDFEGVIRKTLLERLLIETDAPYLLPPLPEGERPKVGKRVTARNEPLFVKYVAKKIAEIKKISIEEIAEITTKNARSLFSI